MKKEIEEEKNEKKSEMDKVAVELTEAIERENELRDELQTEREKEADLGPIL